MKETNTQSPAYIKYMFAEVAQKFAKEKNFEAVDEALNNIKFGEEASAFLEIPYLNTDAGKVEAANIFAKKATIALGKEKISNLYNFYNKDNNSNFLSAEANEKIKHMYGSMGDTTFGEVMSKYLMAQQSVAAANQYLETQIMSKADKTWDENKVKEELQKAKTGLGEDYLNAEKTVEKYNKFAQINEELYSHKTAGLRNIVLEGMHKKSIENLVVDLPSPSVPKQKPIEYK